MENYITSMNQPFIYPFPEAREFEILQGSLARVFQGNIPMDEWGTTTPNLPIDALVFQSREILQNLMQISNIGDNLIMLDKELLSRIQVFLVTEESSGKHHSVTNLFTQENTVATVPDLSSQEPNSPDYLGCYVHDTGAIYIWIEKVFDRPLIFQKVLLHEFIHLLFDVIRRNLPDMEKGPKEETYDNFLVLHCYANIGVDNRDEKDYIVDKIREFINSQPLEYMEAIAIFDKFPDWFSARNEIINKFF